jgi:hypothetical protein
VCVLAMGECDEPHPATDKAEHTTIAARPEQLMVRRHAARGQVLQGNLPHVSRRGERCMKRPLVAFFVLGLLWSSGSSAAELCVLNGRRVCGG